MSRGGNPAKRGRRWPILASCALLIAGGIAAAWYFIVRQEGTIPDDYTISGTISGTLAPVYSTLTGLEITDIRANSNPTFCVQIPNGSTDGARPQVGLTEAGVVFEAIAETGITRFAAIFQNPNTSVIGPIRSLRPYYLDWDTPFDCTVTHAGGSQEALTAIASGGQRNLDENYEYMWREDSNRAWNNLFTSPSDLLRFNSDHGYNTSNPQTFARLTPTEVVEHLATMNSCDPEAGTADPSNCAQYDRADYIKVNFGYFADYNVRYHYDPTSNTYLRSYENGNNHLVYHCPVGLHQPNSTTECGALVQVAPSAIAVMRVQESTMADGYHEQIATISSGKAYVFQNGEVIEGTWKKSSQASQIEFRDNAGAVISFTPGQLWVTALPQFGNLSWE